MYYYYLKYIEVLYAEPKDVQVDRILALNSKLSEKDLFKEQNGKLKESKRWGPTKRKAEGESERQMIKRKINEKLADLKEELANYRKVKNDVQRNNKKKEKRSLLENDNKVDASKVDASKKAQYNKAKRHKVSNIICSYNNSS